MLERPTRRPSPVSNTSSCRSATSRRSRGWYASRLGHVAVVEFVEGGWRKIVVDFGEGRGLCGPALSAVPNGKASDRLWDAFVGLLQQPGGYKNV